MNYPTVYNNPNGKLEGFSVVKLLIMETGSYNDQFIRPYTMDVRQEHIDAVNNVVGDSPSVTPASLAGVASSFFKIAAVPEKVAKIANGWGTKRCRYLMEIAYNRGGMRTHELIAGYTEHHGISTLTSAAHVDPDLMFFINTVTVVRMDAVPPAIYGNVPAKSPRVVNTSHVLSDHQSAAFKPSMPLNDRIFDLRPQDVVNTLQASSVLHNYNPDNVIDGVSILSNAPKLSARSHCIPSSYTSKILTAFQLSQETNMGIASESLNELHGLVRDPAIDHGGFVGKLRNLAGVAVAAFSYKDLCKLDPTIDQRKIYVKAKQIHNAGNTEYWQGANITTQYASILAQTIPSIMSEVGLTTISFRATNVTSTGTTVDDGFVIVSGQTFATGADLARPAELFKLRLKREVLDDLTFNNQISFTLLAEVDLVGDTRIQLSVNNEPLTPYCVPSFADASFSPMVTSNPTHPANVGYQLGVLLEGLQLPFSNPVINQANYSNPYAINTAPLPSGLVIPVDSPPTTANTPGFNI